MDYSSKTIGLPQSEAVLLSFIGEDKLLALLDRAVNNALDRRGLATTHKQEQEPEIMDMKALEKLTGWKPPTIYQKVSEGKIPYAKPGKHLIFFRSEILEYIKAHRKKTNAEIAAESEHQFLKANKKK